MGVTPFGVEGGPGYWFLGSDCHFVLGGCLEPEPEPKLYPYFQFAARAELRRVPETEPQHPLHFGDALAKTSLCWKDCHSRQLRRCCSRSA